MRGRLLESKLVVLWTIIVCLLFVTFLPNTVIARPPVFKLNLNYHSQIPQGNGAGQVPWGEPGNPALPNHWCTVACLDMIFDFYDSMGHGNPPLPQQEIASVANTNQDTIGTWEMDARRAAHFSQKSLSLNNNPWPVYAQPYGGWNGTGYSWRGPADGKRLGYSAVGSDVAGNWKNISDMDGLKDFLCENKSPLILYFDPDSMNRYEDSAQGGFSNPPAVSDSIEPTVEGHAVVLVGYDDVTDSFFVHDPAVMNNGVGGANVSWPETLFYNSIWTGRFLYCAPWELNRGTLPLGSSASPLDNYYAIEWWGVHVDVRATYSGPEPLDGFYPVSNAISVLNKGSLAIFDGANPQNLSGVNSTGSASPSLKRDGAVFWCVAGPQAGSYPMSIEVQGTTGNLSSESYVNYSDDIGKIRSCTLSVVSKGVDLAFPRPCLDAWEVDHIPQPSSGLTCTLTTVVYNKGELPVPGGAMVNFYYSDPNACQHYPDYALHLVGSATIPSIPPDDSAIVGPVLFTPPTGNFWGESFFDIFTSISCAQDTIQTGWILEDNNVAAKSLRTVQGSPGVPVSMHFWAKNYLSSPAAISLVINRDELPSGWRAQLDVPEDSVMLLPAQGQIPVILTVTPNQCHEVGKVWVYESFYDSSGNFRRVAGGVGLEVKNAIYSDNFNDCSISDWTIYTSSGTFGTTSAQYVSSPCGLHMYSQGSGYAYGRTPDFSLDTTQEFTISTYFRIPNTSNHWFLVLHNNWVQLVIDAGANLCAYQGSHGGVLYLATLNTNQWYHIEAVVDPATRKYKVYLNGVYKGIANFIAPPGTVFSYMLLGEFENGNSNFGEAYWDDISVYGQKSYILGDANKDGIIDVGDVVYLIN